jgi:hypothetical protein
MATKYVLQNHVAARKLFSIGVFDYGPPKINLDGFARLKFDTEKLVKYDRPVIQEVKQPTGISVNLATASFGKSLS